MTGSAAAEFVVQARWLVTMAGPPIDRGWVRIRRGRIVGLGRGRARHDSAVVIDAADSVVLPGLVNAHTHLEFSDIASPLDTGGGLPAWIGRVVDLRRRRPGDGWDEARGAAVRAGLAESAAGGVTAVGEISTGIPSGGYPAGGPRLRVFCEALGLAAASARAAARRADGDVRDLLRAGVAAGVSPHAPYSVAAPLGRRLVAAARRLDLPVAMHVAESRAEVELLRSGSGPFRELLERLGAWPQPSPPLLPTADWITSLARCRRGVVVHGTHLDDDPHALARLARHRDRLCVVVCPRTARAIEGTLPPVGLFQNAGVRVAIGTDSRASAPDLSVLAECRTLAEAGLATPPETLRMATTDAAWALGFERSCGLLAPGRPADLAILRAPSSGTDPCAAVLDPATHLVATLRAGRVIAGGLPAVAAAVRALRPPRA